MAEWIIERNPRILGLNCARTPIVKHLINRVIISPSNKLNNSARRPRIQYTTDGCTVHKPHKSQSDSNQLNKSQYVQL